MYQNGGVKTKVLRVRTGSLLIRVNYFPILHFFVARYCDCMPFCEPNLSQGQNLDLVYFAVEE